MLLFTAGSVDAVQAAEHAGGARGNQVNSNKMDCDAGPAWCRSEGTTCRPEMRGRCGKRRGDWYGARQPVATATEARGLLLDYFAGQGYTVSEVTEKRWGFRADVLDKDGNVIDRVMIDRRSGRIRSLY